MTQTWQYRVTHPWYLSETLFRISTVKHKHDRSQKIINEFSDEIIKKKVNELKQNNCAFGNKSISDGGDVCRKKKTFIEVLLENHHKMSHEQIRDELVTIMIGKYRYGFISKSFSTW